MLVSTMCLVLYHREKDTSWLGPTHHGGRKALLKALMGALGKISLPVNKEAGYLIRLA